MPLHLEPLELTEHTLLAVGALMIIVGAVVLTLRRRWTRALRLPAPCEHNLEPADLLIGLLALLILPSICLSLLDLLPGSPPASQPASAPAVQVTPTGAKILAMTFGPFCTAWLLLWLGRMRFDGGLSGWGLRRTSVLKCAGLAAAAYVAVWPVCAGLLYLTRAVIWIVDPYYLPPEHDAIRTMRADGLPAWMTLLTMINAVILAPIVEELFFRGLLQPALARWWRSSWRAVLVGGCAFGLLHHQVPDTIPTLALFGVVLGYAYAKTRSLTLVVFLHAVFNGKTVLWIILSAHAPAGGAPPPPDRPAYLVAHTDSGADCPIEPFEEPRALALDGAQRGPGSARAVLVQAGRGPRDHSVRRSNTRDNRGRPSPRHLLTPGTFSGSLHRLMLRRNA